VTSDEIHNTVNGHSRVTWSEIRELLRRRHFRALVGVRVVGQLGDGMVQAALTTFVLFSPESQPTPMKIATAFAILLLPYSIFGPFIGVLIDRWPRQRILVWVSLLRAVSVILIGVVVTTGDDGALLGIAVLVSLGIGRFLQATLSAALPHVARDRELVTANAFAPTAGTIASALGGLLGVAIQKLGGDQGVLLALGVSATLQLVTAHLARAMPRELLGPDSVVGELREQLRAVAGQLGDGLQLLRREAIALRAMMVVVLHRSTFGLATVMAIVLLRKSLNHQAAADTALGEFAVLVGGAAIGAFIGAVMTPFMVGRFGVRRWSTIALVVGSFLAPLFLEIVIAWPKHVMGAISLIIAGAFLGWTGQSVKVCGDFIIQTAIDDDHRGRVFAIYDMAVNVGLVSGIVLAANYLAPDGRSVWPLLFIFVALNCATLLLRTPPRQ
jgi:MFS family permease